MTLALGCMVDHRRAGDECGLRASMWTMQYEKKSFEQKQSMRHFPCRRTQAERGDTLAGGLRARQRLMTHAEQELAGWVNSKR